MSSANSDDDYSDMIYTATAIMYWCKFKEVPKSADDFAKVTNINDPNPKLTLPLDKWFKSVQFKVVGEQLKVIRISESSENGETKSTSTATSNCDSFEVITKHPNREN